MCKSLVLPDLCNYSVLGCEQGFPEAGSRSVGEAMSRNQSVGVPERVLMVLSDGRMDTVARCESKLGTCQCELCPIAR